jgi:hypothetical protein
VLWTNRSDRFTVNQNEFFNRRVGDVYYTATPTPGAIGEIPVRVDGRTGDVTLDDGMPLRPGYLLTDGSVEPDAVPVVRDPLLGMTVWRVQRDLVLASTAVTGLYPNDTWSGPGFAWSRARCRGGSLTVNLSGDAQLFPRGTTVTASTGASVRVVPNTPARLVVPVRSKRGTCRVTFRVSPTAVPARLIAGSVDTRVLGVHVNGFAYRP